MALSEEGSDVRHKELHRRSYRKETCRVNKICQETVMKTKRRGPWFPVEIATAGRKHLKDHEGRIRRLWQVVSVYGTVGGEEESPYSEYPAGGWPRSGPPCSLRCTRSPCRCRPGRGPTGRGWSLFLKVRPEDVCIKEV